MIGKIIIGKSFRGCIAYCLNDKIVKQNKDVMKDRAEVLMYNKCFGNEKELVQQFNEVRQLNPKLSKPVIHITLSLAPGEHLSKDKLMELSGQCAKDFGFENNQYIAIAHRDTNHQHVHMVANRIGFDNRTVSDSNNYRKMAKYCRKMEQQYQLKEVLSPVKYLPNEQRSIPRFDQRKELLRQHIKEALKGCSTLQQFELKMQKSGYKIIKGRGISFADEMKVIVKGSDLNYSLQTIERILEKQRTFQSIKLHGKGSDHNVEAATTTRESSQDLKNKESLINVIEDLVKPEQNHEKINDNLLPKKRKKKKRKSQRL